MTGKKNQNFVSAMVARYGLKACNKKCGNNLKKMDFCLIYQGTLIYCPERITNKDDKRKFLFFFSVPKEIIARACN